MVGYSFTGLLGTGISTFTGGITDLEVAWINGAPRLYSANLPGLGAGYAAFDLSGASGAASLIGVQSYANAVNHLRAPDFFVASTGTGTSGNLIAAGPSPSGWASYGLGSGGGFGAALNTPLAFNPVAVTGWTTGGSTYVYFAVHGSAPPLAYRLTDSGALSAPGTGGVTLGGGEVDDLAVAQTADGTFLLSVSAADNIITTHSIGANGALGAGAQLSAQIGTGFSKPTEIASLTIQGASYAIVAANESSSLSVFRILPGGVLHNVDHLVDGLMNRFQGATALSVLQQGDRGFVAIGGADGGVDIMTLLPDGRLVHLMTITDSATMSLDNVSALSLTQSGTRAMLFAASATETGITQIDLDLGAPGSVRWNEAGTVMGTSGDDVLGAGQGTTALYGGGGDDLIVGGGAGGAAELWGGTGSDRFILSESAATIVIRDFEAGIDRLDLSSFPMLRNMGQISIVTTATGAEITVSGTLIRIDSHDGNPIPATAFPLSHLIPVYRFPPDAGPLPPPTPVSGTVGNDRLQAAASGGTLYGLAGDDSLTGGGGNDTLDGGLGRDTIIGGAGSDDIFGWAGNDAISGGLGNDALDGGADNDTITGDAGEDTIDGGIGQDSLDGGDGDDLLRGGDGQDIILGGAGRDTILAGTENDTIRAGLNDDLIEAGDGNDSILGEAGNDTIHGEAGNDWMNAEDGNDLLFGGSGNDSIAGLVGHDTLYGGAGDDILWETSGNDLLQGDDGNDTLYGGDGDDQLDGGAGADSLYGGAGNDTAWGASENDYVYLGGGNDTCYGGDGDDTMQGESGVDLLIGGEGNDGLAGQAGDDWLFGEAGNDVLWDIEGRNNLFGGEGDDTLYGSSGASLLDAGGGNDSIIGGSAADLVYGGDGNENAMTAGGNDTVYGGSGADTVAADSGNDLLFGGNGNDILWSNLGNDTLHGEDGDDYLWEGVGEDLIYGGSGNDSIFGGDGYDRLQGGEDNDLVSGGAQNDVIYGGEGQDIIQGGSGADWLFGGADADRFVFSNRTDSVAWSGYDYILDFSTGADKIDLSGLGLHWAGWNWTPGAFGLSAAGHNEHLILLADTNGDGATDFAIGLLYTQAFAPSDIIF